MNKALKNKMNKPILHLNAKRKWYNMIKSKEKKEEYRDITKYWHSRLKKFNWLGGFTICFSNGYAKNRDQFYIECIGYCLGMGRKEWGASGEQQFILSLGNIL